MGNRSGKRSRGRPAAIALLAAAFLLAFALAAPAAGAFGTFTTGGMGIPACDTCHGVTATHGNHGAVACGTCHVGGTSPYNPPVPSACADCHGGAAAVLAGATHTSGGCGTTPGCHGVPAPAPTIASFTPLSGAVGATVTLTGTDFNGATAVAFNGVPATVFSVVSNTKITAKVPVGATSGTISVTTSGGTTTSTASFTVLIKSKISIKLVGLTAGAIKVNRYLTIKGAVTPGHAAKVTVTLQRKVGTKWVKMKVVSRTSNATSGAYSYKYKVTRKGSWRVKTAAAKTAAYTSATTAWKTFRVK